jgi:hypothetical protein
MKYRSPDPTLPVEWTASGSKYQAHKIAGTETPRAAVDPSSLLQIARNKLRIHKPTTEDCTDAKDTDPIALNQPPDACNKHLLEKNVNPATMRVPSLLHVSFPNESPTQQALKTEAGGIGTATEVRRQKALKQLAAAPDSPRVILTDTHSDPNHVILTIAIRHVAVAELMVKKSRYDPLLLLEMAKRYGKHVN